MRGSVDLLVLLELLVYLLVRLPLCLILIPLVFGLAVAQTTHLPAGESRGPGEGDAVGESINTTRTLSRFPVGPARYGAQVSATFTSSFTTSAVVGVW